MSESSLESVGVAPTPAPARPRIVGYDVARCLAILSMVYVNFEVVIASGSRTPGWLRTVANCFEGNASALFVTLAGIGLVLLDSRSVILKRALFLLGLGYLWQAIWPGDILHYYAFYLVAGALVLPLRARWLWLLALSTTGAWLLCAQFFDYGAGWQWLDLSYRGFWTIDGQARNLLFNGWHPLLPWLAFLFTGMALGRWGIAEPRKRRSAGVASIGIYFAAFFTSRALTALPDDRPIAQQFLRWYEAPEALWAMDSIPPGPLYVVSAAAAAVFVIALSLEVTASASVARRLAPLARGGQLALTFYLSHVFFLYFLIIPLESSFEGKKLELAAISAVVFGAGAVLFAVLWRRRFRHGPLEWVLRRCSRRSRVAPAAGRPGASELSAE